MLKLKMEINQKKGMESGRQRKTGFRHNYLRMYMRFPVFSPRFISLCPLPLRISLLIVYSARVLAKRASSAWSPLHFHPLSEQPDFVKRAAQGFRASSLRNVHEPMAWV